MRTEIEVNSAEQMITMGADLVYAQKPYWCGAGFYPLKMSLLRPRAFFEYDDKTAPMPVIVWLCGGGWTETEHNVWIPELTYFAKHGFCVASVSYSLSPTWFFPEPVIDIKQAIRFLRAHAEQFHIDPERIAVMGESAGAHFAAITAASNGKPEWEKGEYLEYSSSVQAAVAWYTPVNMADLEGRGEVESYRTRPQTLTCGLEYEPQSISAGVLHVRDHDKLCREMDPRTYIDGDTPPFMLLHGTGDTLIDISNSEALYRSLQEAGVRSDLLVIKGAQHGDQAFIQPCVKDRIIQFLHEVMQ